MKTIFEKSNNTDGVRFTDENVNIDLKSLSYFIMF